MNNKAVRGLTAIGAGVAIWLCPVPEGLKPQVWNLLAIFVATILAFILNPLPMGAVALISITVTALTGTLKLGEVLSGFSNRTVWLIVAAFLFSRSFVKTGLGERVAFQLIKYFGTSSLKLAYILTISDLIIAPATPSNTARAGGMLFPIVRSLALSFKSEPGPSSKRIGSFLIQSVYHGDTMVSAMFLTAMAGNPLMVAFAADVAGLSITWGTWFLAASVPVFCTLVIIPLFVYWYESPEIKKTPEARGLAEKALLNMGPMKNSEKWLVAIFCSALFLWATTSFTGLNTTVIALCAVCAMVICNVLEWSDVISEKTGWDAMIWMGSLICLAGFLNKLGLIAWFAEKVGVSLNGVDWRIAMIILIIAYAYSHYAFASLVAHISALYAAFLTVAVAVGTPPFLAAFSLFMANAACQSLTHYAAGPAPVFFGAGYVSQARWWALGFFISAINIIVCVGLGAVWWKILGFW